MLWRKYSISNSGKNLFTLDNDERFTKQEDGSYVNNQRVGTATRPLFIPKGTYTISYDLKSPLRSNSRIEFLDRNGKVYPLYISSTGEYIHLGKTYTFEEDIVEYRFNCSEHPNINELFVKNLMFEAGSVETEFEEYTSGIPIPSPENPSPIVSKYTKGRYKTNLPGITIKLDDDLRSVPCGVSDYVEVDIVTKEKYISRQIFRTIPSEDIYFSKNAEYGDTMYQIQHNRLGTTQNAYDNNNNINTLCTHLKARRSNTIGDEIGFWKGRTDPTYTGQAARGTVLMFKDPSFDDDDAFRAFLRKGVEVCFALAEPTITLL